MKNPFADGDTITTAWKDEGSGLICVNTFQDVEDIIENNKRLQNEPQTSDWGRHIASIPNNFINLWLHEEWQRGNVSIKLTSKEFDAIIYRKLRDPDWAWLRTDK